MSEEDMEQDTGASSGPGYSAEPEPAAANMDASPSSMDARGSLGPSGEYPSRKPIGWVEEDDALGGVRGFMCLTDFECELGQAAGGNRIYASIEDLRESRRCVSGCGIAEVRVVGVRIVNGTRRQASPEMPRDPASSPHKGDQ